MPDLDLLFERLFRQLSSLILQLRYRRYLNAYGPLLIGPGVLIRGMLQGAGDAPSLRVITGGLNRIGGGTVIQGSGTLTLGTRTYIAEHCFIGCNAEIAVGRDVMIASSVSIRDTDHEFGRTDIPMNRQGISTKPIIIEDDVWIGHGAVILKGLTVGTGAIVAAGAVVTRDVAPYTVVGGVPAKQIGSRLKDSAARPGDAA